MSHLLDAKVAIDDVQTGKVMGDFIYFANCHVMDDDNHSDLKPFVHLKDQDGKNVLYYAVKEDYTNCNLIKLLLKAKANPCMKDNNNYNVLEQVKHSKLNISPKVFETLRQAIRDATPPAWYEQFFAVKAQPSEQKDHTHMRSLKK